MKTRLITVSIFVFVLHSCKQNKELDPKSEGQKDSIEVVAAQPQVKVANLEDIPFELPVDWIYKTYTQEEKSNLNVIGLTAYSSNPVDQSTTVTVWDFEVETIQELLSLFKKDMLALLQNQEGTVDFELKDNIVHGNTVQRGIHLKWKGKYFEHHDKLRFVVVGTQMEYYQEREKFSEGIFSSINAD